MKNKRYLKIIGHCHYPRKYRDAANNISNLKYSLPKKTPIVSHNGSNYDCHFSHKRVSKKI